MEQMRSEFEAWWENWCGEAPFLGWDKFRTPGGYNDPDIHMQWEAWKGGRAAIDGHNKAKSEGLDENN